MAAPRDKNIDTIEADICRQFELPALRPNQKQAIKALINGKDIFVGTKTGSGKSLVYECIPAIFPGSSVVIVAPLVSIMNEQCKKLIDLGFKATYLGKDIEEAGLIEDGAFQFLFGSPEQLVGDLRWRDVLKSDVYKKQLKALVVDEAHTVIQWGESHDDEDPFRVWFSRIGELRSLCPKAQMVALTATSGPSNRRKIMQQLCFNSTSEVIVESPDRDNIKISAKSVPNNYDFDKVFGWLIEQIKDRKQEMPRYIIFCETIAEVSKLHFEFVRRLGSKFEHLNMFHSKTSDKIKEKIRNDMILDGKIRILICTNSAGMGVNFYGVHNVIHFGLPREMDTFVQQMGRCGRDGQFSHELLLYKNHKTHMKKVEADLIKLVKNDDCRRHSLCNSYMTKNSEILPLHNCCDICEGNCKCGQDICPNKHQFFCSEEQSSLDDEMIRDVSDQEKRLVKQKLDSLKIKLSFDQGIVLSELIHGLTNEVVSGIVDKCHLIFTPNDVLKCCNIWSYDVAVSVCNVVNDVFGDAEMYAIYSDSDVE